MGGIRTFLRYVYTNIGSERYEYTLLAPEMPETNVLLDDLKRLELRHIPINSSASDLDFLRCVSKVIWANSFDLIHSHGFTSGICASLAAFARNVPHILTCHDVFTADQFSGVRGLGRKLALNVAFLLVNRIHCVSNDARDNFLATLPVLRILKHGEVVAITNGIEVEAFTTPMRRDLRKELGLLPDTFLIGFMGRFMAQKGFRYLIDAVELLKQKRDLDKAPVVLAFGQLDGYIREEQESVKTRGLTDSVFFLPFVPNVASTLKGLDVVVMPSLWEACGLLAMESLVAGVPLVGSNCIGLREVLRDTPARIVQSKDSVALAEALFEEICRPTVDKAQEFARVATDRFQVKKQAVAIETIMHEVIEKKKAYGDQQYN